MSIVQDLAMMQDQIQAALVSTTKVSGQLSAEDLSFQRSLNPSLGASLDEQSERLLDLSGKLLKSASSISDVRVPHLSNSDDLENDWRSIVDVIDALLEKADSCLDEYTGVIKRNESPVPSTTSMTKPKTSLSKPMRTQNLVKPQLAFDQKPDNQTVSPWRPLITKKPHAIVPLDESCTTFMDELQHEQYHHPYESEITNLTYPAKVYAKTEPIPYLPFDTTSAVFIDTYEGVLAMLAELKQASEIAIDLEHHDTRTYVGLVSLMQVSTRHKDWIIDTLRPWRQDLQILNEVFADPEILKVFHGAFMDIVWLQRDLGLYVVGLFDTHHASRVLGYPGGSLAYLLKRFVDFDADKKYQMADWRIRPLPEEMFFYARADTHFLLYVYDNLRNELLNESESTASVESRLEMVLNKSRETSLLRFERQIYDEATGRGPGGWYALLYKSPALLSNQQFAVYRAIHTWRDQIARKDDESTHYVMPNHVLFTIAKLMPSAMAALTAAAHPISHNVKSRIQELLDVVKQAMTRGTTGPNMMDVMHPQSVGATAKSTGFLTAPVMTGLVIEGAEHSVVKSEKSMFWGNTFGSSVWSPQLGSAVNAMELHLAIPLPPLNSLAVDDALETPLPHSAKQDPTSAIAGIEAEQPFVLKSGNKRKLETADASVDKEASSEENFNDRQYDITLNEDAQLAKAAKRAARKERKRQKRGALASNSSKGEEIDTISVPVTDSMDTVPFDYSKAATVLHHKPINRGAKDAKKHTKTFDPYAKSTNAPKGMRRLQSERSGKSATFKS